MIKTIKNMTKIDELKQEFLNEYEKLHECCPVCGSTNCVSELSNYSLNLKKKDSYKDLNICQCLSCNDKHTMHERVPKKVSKKRK